MVVDSTRHVHDSQRQATLLELITIAEGVETETQLDFLKTHGCDEV